MICKYCGKPVSGGICSSCGKAVSLSDRSSELDQLLGRAPGNGGVSDQRRLEAAFDSGVEKGRAEGYKSGLSKARKEMSEQSRRQLRRVRMIGVCAAALLLILSVIVTNRLSVKKGYDSGYRLGHSAGYSEGQKAGSQSGYDTGYEEGKSEGYQSGHDDGYEEGYLKAREDALSAAEVLPEVLRIGASGDEVRQLQEALAVLGFLESDQADGEFGEQTENAVKAFQEKFELEVTGEADPETVARIAEEAAALSEEGSTDSAEESASDPAPEATPAAEATPTPEATPAPEAAPVPETTPAAEQTPETAGDAAVNLKWNEVGEVEFAPKDPAEQIL